MNNGLLHKAKRAAEMIVVADPQSTASEAYRSLRTNVGFASHEHGCVLLITSVGPAEGKSCIVANLGIALAQSGRRTLIIDCDFRKPVMHKIFSVSNKVGFTNMITNKTNGAKRVIRLPVSGPFHSPLMEDAAEAFRAELVSARIEAPRFRFVSSVSGRAVSDVEEIRSLLSEQICSPVQWTRVMETLGPIAAVEVGPGRVLQGLAKRAANAPRVLLAGSWEAANADWSWA